MSYPHWVCDDCGREANRRTCIKRYGAEPKQAKFLVSTFHKGECDVCGEVKNVTESRDYFYPDFSLLKSNRKIYANKSN